MAEQDPSATPRFMDLQDPRYAYMFGFIQADGHLSAQSRQRGSLTVEVSVRDIELLEEFQGLTPYPSSITKRVRSTNFATEHHSAKWSLHALEARTTLNELGVPYGRKSTTIAPPRCNFARRDYLRGVIDADGSVGHTGQGFPFVSLTTSSTAISACLSSYAQQVTGAERLTRRNSRDGVYNILYTKEAAQQLAADLYYPGCLSLTRKRTAAATLSSWVRPATMKMQEARRRWTVAEDRRLLEVADPAIAASELGRSESACRQRSWRLRTGGGPWPAG
ncbi:LAGLIDADG family homing endonuclease [Streptomyces sp. NPDC086023]|uniref:LAGLIDADG family homing endonuclease n=1 Tax=Streptomyces sp. NPDC086023 TaxID=3365746 RepID=UPI0037D10479